MPPFDEATFELSMVLDRILSKGDLKDVGRTTHRVGPRHNPI